MPRAKTKKLASADRPQTKNLIRNRKGERIPGSGRAKGQPNKTTRDLREAILHAAELSKHSKTKDLTGYLVFLANERPETYTTLLGRMVPLQAKVQVEANVNVIKAKPELAMTAQELADYYAKLRALPPSTKPLVIIDNDTGEPLYSEVAE